MHFMNPTTDCQDSSCRGTYQKKRNTWISMHLAFYDFYFVIDCYAETASDVHPRCNTYFLRPVPAAYSPAQDQPMSDSEVSGPGDH